MAFLLHHLLSESAVRYPDRKAVLFKDLSITYAELERETNKLAHELHDLGIVKGDRVGIYMTRGISSIVAALGILKAGAAYVPVDPMSPYGRLKYIVTTCGITTLVTLRERLTTVEQAFPGGSPLRNVLVMDRVDAFAWRSESSRLVEWEGISNQLSGDVPRVNVTDSDLAYILFTSGSTGVPKGVMISHLNSLTFVNSAADFFGIGSEDRCSHICPLHFDMSVVDMYLPLKVGATVVVIPETSAIFPVKLAESIARYKISVWNSVPSALSLLANLTTMESYDFSSLRLVLFAGEVFPVKYLRRLQAHVPEARFCNMYGQTEANSSTYYWVERGRSESAGVLPIGKSLPNFEVFALDEKGKKVEDPGEEGELYVSASTVAMGYWGDPERTEKSFVRNPLRPESGERVYRTGDLVRLDAERNYVFLGRKDHMIKSRGYRIEIGEIEAVLCNHPEVRSAVVIPIPDELIGNRISAFVVPSAAGKIDREDLLNYCSRQLPKYMIPETVEFRDSLPTTSSGKVDRKTLLGQIVK